MTSSTASAPGTSRWVQAWPDALAFVGGLAVAWFAGWNTTDLVWSLWLSSLTVGYAMIIWSAFLPAVWLQRERRTGTATVALVGGLLMLAFFTVHFGFFHLVHSIFLNGFFPVGPKQAGLLNPGLYAEICARYWYFVPLAVLAERQAFRLPPRSATSETDLPIRHPGVIAGNSIMAPYKNVVRLHLLIFFFAAAHFARLDSFLVYAVVYAVYFFPWRLVLGDRTGGLASA